MKRKNLIITGCFLAFACTFGAWLLAKSGASPDEPTAEQASELSQQAPDAKPEPESESDVQKADIQDKPTTGKAKAKDHVEPRERDGADPKDAEKKAAQAKLKAKAKRKAKARSKAKAKSKVKAKPMLKVAPPAKPTAPPQHDLKVAQPVPAKHASPPAEGPALAKSVPGKVPVSVIDGQPLGSPKATTTAATKKPKQANSTSFWDLGKPARKPAAPQRSVLPTAAPQRSVLPPAAPQRSVLPPAGRVAMPSADRVEVNAPPSALARVTALPPAVDAVEGKPAPSNSVRELRNGYLAIDRELEELLDR